VVAEGEGEGDADDCDEYAVGLAWSFCVASEQYGFSAHCVYEEEAYEAVDEELEEVRFRDGHRAVEDVCVCGVPRI